MLLLERMKNAFLYAGVNKQEYEKVKPNIIENNRRNLAVFTGIASFSMCVMILLSFIFPIFSSSRNSYIVCVVISSILFIISRKYAKNHPMLIYVNMYIFAGMLLCIGIAFGTIIQPHQASTSFAILMFAVPLWFTDRPARVNLMTAISIVIYFIAAMYTQDETMLTFNASVVLPYGALCIIATTLQMEMKVQSFVTQYNELMLKENVSEKEAYIQEISNLNEQLKENQIILEKAKEEAESANNAKTRFLFNMSHDIRTPMNAIMGFRDLLEKHQEDPEKRKDYLNKIQDSSNVLLSIINNVLEMSRIEKGTLEIEETAWSAEQFNDTLYSVFDVMMKQKNITFTQEVNVQHPYVFCDSNKLREIFINILSNAYKYTNPGGSVKMSLVELPSNEEGKAIYQTTISDTGIGMSEEFLPHIFEEFARENNTTDAKIEGTGLGMSIVKRLVDILHGTIEVKSTKGVGSSFVITIAHNIADSSNLVKHADIEIDPRLFKDKHILLAEDNDMNSEIAKEILSEAGFIVDRAEDGKVCIDMLINAEANYYSAILMDIQMPNMNGYEATKVIRALDDYHKANIKIIAMTANAFEEDKREAQRSGMNGHLAKPINVKELMTTLTAVID